MSSRILAGWTAVTVFALATLASGCGGDDSGSSAPTTTTTALSEQLGTDLDRLAQEGTSSPAPIAGEWTGTLHQTDTNPFPIRVRIESLTDPERNVVRYGGEIGCGGTWRFLAGDGPDAQFREVIDRGAGGDCKGSGLITLTPAGENLRYSFVGGGIESDGLLRRG